MNILYLFVEGYDDERFLTNIYKNKNFNFKFYRYSSSSLKDVNNMLHSIKESNNDYLFFIDADGDTIENKRIKTIKKYKNCEYEKIKVVQFEIESWYIAGVNREFTNKMRFKYFRSTDKLSKETFDNMIPKNSNRISFMIDLLKKFDSDEACDRNKSFKIFYDFFVSN